MNTNAKVILALVAAVGAYAIYELVINKEPATDKKKK